jgi:ankyrin repeat protein
VATPKGETALHISANYDSNGDQSAATSLLLAHGAAVDAPDVHGVTPVMIAANRANKILAEKLRAKGANLNAVDKQGRSVLMRAAMSPGYPAYREMVQWLLAHGAAGRYDGGL